MDTPSAVTDAESERLVARAQRGDVRAFSTLYLRHWDLVYGYGSAILRDEHEAEDVAQDVFMRVLRLLPRYECRPEQPFRVLLLRITRNRAIDRLRKSRRCDPTPPAELAARSAEARDDLPGSFDAVSDGQIALSLKRLPVSQRQVLVLRYLYDLSTREVADIIGTTPHAVRNLQLRGLKFLRASLAPRTAPLVPAR